MLLKNKKSLVLKYYWKECGHLRKATGVTIFEDNKINCKKI